MVEDLVPGKLSSLQLYKPEESLQEGVSIRDNRSIFDSLLSESGKTKDAVELTSLIRPHLGRSDRTRYYWRGRSSNNYSGTESEQLLNNALKEGSQSRDAFLEPKLIDALADAIAGQKYSAEEQGFPAVLVVSPTIRPWLSRYHQTRLGNLSVLAYTEIPEDQEIRVVGKVGIQENHAQEVAA